jgi:hypothetical protein
VHLVEMNAEIPPWARDGVQFALAWNAWSIRLEPSWAVEALRIFIPSTAFTATGQNWLEFEQDVAFP